MKYLSSSNLDGYNHFLNWSATLDRKKNEFDAPKNSPNCKKSALPAALPGGDAWLGYLRLFEESRFVHVTSLDFMCLTALAPFWMANDAEGRKWEQR